MNLTEFTLNKNRLSIFIFFIVGVLGLTTFFGLPQDSMPPYTVRVANVVTIFPGAGPERIESLITQKVEEKVQEIPELKEVTSISRSNMSIVTITLRDDVQEKDLQPIWDFVRRKMDGVSFPEGSSWELQDDDIGVVYGIMLGLSTDMSAKGEMEYSYAEMKEIADDLRDEFIALDGVSRVEISGDQEEQIFVEFNNSQLAKYGITAARLENIISSTNILYSGGELNVGEERLVIEPTGNYNSVDELKRTIVDDQNGRILYLEDIADIRRGYVTPQSQLVSVDNKPSLALSIASKTEANVVEIGKVIDARLDELKGDLPVGLNLKRLSSIDYYVDGEVSNFINNLIQTVVIVLLVMLIFLGVRTGFIIASLVPMVILATFAFMGVLGQGINQVTLAALIMALGMMVDNGVVVSETVLVKLDEGVSKMDSVIQACQELTIPLLISTLTTSVAFLSFYLAESTMGEIVGPLFVVISVALICSWFFGMTLITMLCFYLLKVQKNAKESIIDKTINFLKTGYTKLINFCLKQKWLTLAVIVGLFFFSLFLFQYIPFIFFPDSERNLITMDIKLPQGTRIEKTKATVEAIEAFMIEDLQLTDERTRGIIDWSAFIGEGPNSYDLGYQPDQPNPNYAHVLVNTSSGDDNGYVINALDQFCFNSFPTADIKISRLKNGGGGAPIEILVSGRNADQLSAISENVSALLASVAGTKNVKDDWGPKIKKIVVDIDPGKAQNSGLTNQDIALSLYTALSGYNVGDYREGDDNISILMQDENHQQLRIEDLESLNIYAQGSGIHVPLSQIANVGIEWQYAVIARKDLERTITISCEVQEGANASNIMKVFTPMLDQQVEGWPAGFSYELGGDDKDSSENMGSIAAWLPLSGFLIILLLIIQFNSIRKTTIILFTIPLGIIGVILGLLMLRSFFGFFAFLGIISLAGIIINNGIVLIDRIDIELGEGKSLVQAVKDACLQRFRPILLTTFTTVLGMIPLYMSGGLMWEPMAASIMVGLLFGTMITLIFVPVTYMLMYGKKGKKIQEEIV